jgi:hypothetical protein
MFGHICYWCGGDRIGDFDLITSLRDVLVELDSLRWATGKRANERFGQMAASDVFRRIDRALFGSEGSDDYETAEEEQWARHRILPSVDSFDSWKAYLVQDHNRARVVFSSSPFERVVEVILEPGEVDAVLEEARMRLDEIYEQELSAANG